MAKDNNIELHPKTDEPSGYAKYQDCTPCRVIGTATFTGLGVATYYTMQKELRKPEIQAMWQKRGLLWFARAGATALPASLLAGAAYRWFGP